MVKLTKIYTRTGDDGSTGLVGGTRVPKNSLRVAAYGELDELNAHLGLCFTRATEDQRLTLAEKLLVLENELFDMGAELATPPGAEWPSMTKVQPQHVEKLESWIDELNGQLAELRSFVLPGGTLLNASLHIARCVCRRVERSILTLNEVEPVSPHLIHYVNRLSDLLFVMSRHEMFLAKKDEVLWKPGATLPPLP
jgi:cob(I)alamin adenosyltransferase